MTERPAHGRDGARTVTLRIADPALADRVIAMLADEVDRVVLDGPDDADVAVTDHLPVDAQPPTIVLADHANGIAALQAGAGIAPLRISCWRSRPPLGASR